VPAAAEQSDVVCCCCCRLGEVRGELLCNGVTVIRATAGCPRRIFLGRKKEILTLSSNAGIFRALFEHFRAILEQFFTFSPFHPEKFFFTHTLNFFTPHFLPKKQGEKQDEKQDEGYTADSHNPDSHNIAYCYNYVFVSYNMLLGTSIL
jgi:hypothetical protein